MKSLKRAGKKQKKGKSRYFDRDLSWLSFNYRVLQEAKNKEVPLLERLKFLAIYSSNLDEFYSVRVAYHRNILDMKIKTRKDSDVNHKKLLVKIKKTVNKQLEEFGSIYRNILVPELARNDIFITDENNLTSEQHRYVNDYFTNHIIPNLKLLFYNPKKPAPFLENKQIYFAIRLKPINDKEGHDELAFLNIPSDKLPRFIPLPSEKNTSVYIFLDDIMRCCIHSLFPGYEIEHCHSIKIVRDAELFLEENENLVDEIKKQVAKQKTNPPSRFLYDAAMPPDLLKELKNTFKPVKDYMIPGGKYHNFEDFFSFPNAGAPRLRYPEFHALKHKSLSDNKNMFDAIAESDHIVHFPYQDYNYVIRFLENAAVDPKVKSVKMTLYRMADDSKIAKALIAAAQNGKKVTAFVEIKARFNEIANIYWAQEFTNAGIEVIYSFRKIKVHSKMCMVEREENGELKRYAFLSTGNFNEKTARIYCDHGYFTARPELTSEAESIFKFFRNPSLHPKFKNLLVAPFNMRKRLESHIRKEIRNAKAGKPAAMILKMNSLEDKLMIDQLYEASHAGVKITIIVRGICCLVPEVKGMSENIKVISIVDRFLEHGRIFIFHNNGKEKIFISSADLMSRNLNRRIETAFPILDENSKQEIKTIIDLQLKDNTKARKLNKTQSNPYKKSTSRVKVRAQLDTYRYLRHLNK